MDPSWVPTFSSSTYHPSKIQIVSNPIPAFLELLVESHDVERVQAVHDGRPKLARAENGCAVSFSADGTELVLTPGIRGIVIPRVLHHLEKGMPPLKGETGNEDHDPTGTITTVI